MAQENFVRKAALRHRTFLLMTGAALFAALAFAIAPLSGCGVSKEDTADTKPTEAHPTPYGGVSGGRLTLPGKNNK